MTGDADRRGSSEGFNAGLVGSSKLGLSNPNRRQERTTTSTETRKRGLGEGGNPNSLRGRYRHKVLEGIKVAAVRAAAQGRRENAGDRYPSSSSQACYPLCVAGGRCQIQRPALCSAGRPKPCLSLRGVLPEVLSASGAMPDG